MRKATMNISDMHFGDQAQLFNSLNETIAKAIQQIREFKPDKTVVILNGDAVAGRGIFRFQSVQNVVQLGAWQAAWTAWEISRWHKELAADEWVVLLGNHDNSNKENLAQQLAIFLKLLGVPTRYAQREEVGNFTCDDENGIWYHAEHGSGYSSYYANSYSEIRACWRKFVEVAQVEKVVISRFLRAHTHWLNIGQTIGLETAIDTTGGWHRQERLSLASDIRQTGVLLYLADGADMEVRAVPADLSTLVEETKSPSLMFRNMERAGFGLARMAEWGVTERLW